MTQITLQQFDSFECLDLKLQRIKRPKIWNSDFIPIVKFVSRIICNL